MLFQTQTLKLHLMANLDNAQKEFLLKFFELPHLPGWKNIATKLLENESCIVAGTDKIWIGGIGNFIKTKSADILIDCLEYTFELEQFLSSKMLEERVDLELSKLEKDIENLKNKKQSIETLIYI